MADIYNIVRGKTLAENLQFLLTKGQTMAKEKYYSSKKSGMISENRSAVANMPQEVVYRAYPQGIEDFDAQIDDTISGIDAQMREDYKRAKAKIKPMRY